MVDPQRQTPMQKRINAILGELRLSVSCSKARPQTGHCWRRTAPASPTGNRSCGSALPRAGSGHLSRLRPQRTPAEQPDQRGRMQRSRQLPSSLGALTPAVWAAYGPGTTPRNGRRASGERRYNGDSPTRDAPCPSLDGGSRPDPNMLEVLRRLHQLLCRAFGISRGTRSRGLNPGMERSGRTVRDRDVLEVVWVTERLPEDAEMLRQIPYGPEHLEPRCLVPFRPRASGFVRQNGHSHDFIVARRMGQLPQRPESREVTSDAARGAYGLRLAGLTGCDRLARPREDRLAVDPDRSRDLRRGSIRRPTGRPQCARSAPDRRLDRVDRDGCRAILRPGAALGRRDRPSVPRAVAIVASHWHDRESIHSGAFVVDGTAWGIVGDRSVGRALSLQRSRRAASMSSRTTCSSWTNSRFCRSPHDRSPR